MAPIQIPQLEFAGILPALVLSLAGVAIMLIGLFLKRGILTASLIVTLIGTAIAAVANAPIRGFTGAAFSGLLVADSFSWFVNLVILISLGLTALASVRYLSDDGIQSFEYFALLLFCAAGMMFMVSGNHLLTIFIGLETLSISVYVLTGLLPENLRSKEAALKYLVLGAFSSAVFLYGAALVYGVTGSANLDNIITALKAGAAGPIAIVGMAMLLVGFAFKTAAAPFHMWTPDVYEGAPTPLTGFMSVGVKAAAFAAFARVFYKAFPTMQVDWAQILWILAVLTMIIGNFAALAQTNIKRMLAYSSIAHAGYILIGMIAGGELGLGGMLYYLLAYTFTNIGAFGIVTVVGLKGEANVNLDDYRGLSKTHPILAAAMSVFVFSLAGIPPTAGFVGKFTIFRAAIDSGYYWLIIIAVLTSAVSVFYYFRVIMKMYMEAPDQELSPIRFNPAMIMALSVALVGVLYIGMFPKTYIDLAVQSVKPLF